MTARSIGARFTLVLAMLAGLSLQSAAPAAAADRIDVVTSSTGWLYVVAYIAQAQGYFARQGLDVSIRDGNGGSNAVAALVGGSAQIGVVGLANMAKAVARGIAMRAVGTSLLGFPQFVIARTSLEQETHVTAASPFAQRVALLKGRSVGVEDIGGSSGNFIRALLQAGNLPPNAATVINLNGNTAQLASLKAGRIDTIVQVPPFSGVPVADGYGFVLADASRDLPGIAEMEYIIQAVTADYLAHHRDIVRRYLIAIHQAEDLAWHDPAAARNAFYAFLASVHAPMGQISEAARAQAWKDTQATIPQSLVISSKGIAENRRFFHVPDKLTDADLVDNTLAQQIMAAK